MDLSNWDLDYTIPKGTSHTAVLNSTYEVQKIYINLTDLGLWRNLIPKGTLKTRFEPSSIRMSAWKNIKLHSRFEPKNPASVISILSLDYKSQRIKVLSKLFMSRSQLREQICQCSKSDRQEWQSLVVLKGTNIDLWKAQVSCFCDPVTKYLVLMQGSQVKIQGCED